MSGEIENPMIFDKSREINETHEVKAIGRCEECTTMIYSDDTYIKVVDYEDLLCNEECLVSLLTKEKYIEKIYGDR